MQQTVLAAQAVQMHSPKIAQLHKLCMLTFQKLARFGRQNSTSMIAVFCISARASRPFCFWSNKFPRQSTNFDRAGNFTNQCVPVSPLLVSGQTPVSRVRAGQANTGKLSVSSCQIWKKMWHYCDTVTLWHCDTLTYWYRDESPTLSYHLPLLAVCLLYMDVSSTSH